MEEPTANTVADFLEAILQSNLPSDHWVLSLAGNLGWVFSYILSQQKITPELIADIRALKFGDEQEWREYEKKFDGLELFEKTKYLSYNPYYARDQHGLEFVIETLHTKAFTPNRFHEMLKIMYWSLIQGREYQSNFTKRPELFGRDFVLGFQKCLLYFKGSDDFAQFVPFLIQFVPADVLHAELPIIEDIFSNIRIAVLDYYFIEGHLLSDKNIQKFSQLFSHALAVKPDSYLIRFILLYIAFPRRITRGLRNLRLPLPTDAYKHFQDPVNAFSLLSYYTIQFVNHQESERAIRFLLNTARFDKYFANIYLEIISQINLNLDWLLVAVKQKIPLIYEQQCDMFRSFKAYIDSKPANLNSEK